MRVLGEVRRHPVHDDPDAPPVEGVHEGHEVGGRAVTAGGRVVAERLVAPGGVVGVLGHREQLHVGEAHLAQVVGELLGHLAVGRQGAPLRAPPRAQVHLVHRHRPVQGVPALALVHPLRVAPRVGVEVGDRGSGARLVGLEGERHRVGLEREQPAVPSDDLVLVARAESHPGDEQLPEPVARVQAHRLTSPVPAVPVADHADPPRVGSPHHEAHALHALVTDWVRAEPLEEAVVGALAEQVQVVGAEGRREAVGILDLGDLPLVVDHSKPVREREAAARHLAFPEAGRMHRAQRADGAVGHHRRHRAGGGEQGPHADHALAAGVRAQHREGVTVLAGDDSVDRVGRERNVWHGWSVLHTRSGRASGVV